MEHKLKEKRAIVTGGANGIGKAVAIALEEAGAKVWVVDKDKEGLDHLRSHYPWIHTTHLDLADADEILKFFRQIEVEWRFADILVNNAGIIRRAAAVEFSEQDWDDVVDVNLKAAFFLAQQVAKHLIERKAPGKIVNIASLLSFQGGIRVPSYTASKSGILGLTRLLANEWAGHDINVNGIAPGYMATDNTQALRDDPQRHAEILGRIPAGRWGTPEDLAGAVIFLCSDAARYVHGHTLAVDGGWLAR